MKAMRSVKLSLATAGLALAFVWGGCSTTPKVERYAPPPIGSTWTNNLTNTGSYGSASTQATNKAEERQWEGKRVLAFATAGGVILADPSDGGWLAILGPDGKPTMSFEPRLSWEYPLVVGKTWTRSHRFTAYARNETVPFDATWKVDAYEEVTVPAGTFKAFKIVYTDTTGNENLQWFFPELGIFGKQINSRTDKHRAGAGTRQIELVSHSIGKQ